MESLRPRQLRINCTSGVESARGGPLAPRYMALLSIRGRPEGLHFPKALPGQAQIIVEAITLGQAIWQARVA